ncbi:hypothetical protein QN277_010223 [Acacia crassicarpa]|uniref:Uncharacterized protein n=1 Tax=Acacia crassicarpa TaxID=499986 RepID=A0AAE1M535_9FABA|nr:hypothetical protein QN277_010223 [Acacia crassicarpa]
MSSTIYIYNCQKPQNMQEIWEWY